MAVIRSGPMGNEMPELFTIGSLCKTPKWLEGRDSKLAFADRKSSRVMRTYSVDPDVLAMNSNAFFASVP